MINDTCYLNSTLQCIFSVEFSTNFLPVNCNNSLVITLKIFTRNKMQCQDVELIRNMLISKERELLLSDAQHGFFQSSQQQDAHETLFKIFDILHKITEIDLFPELVIS